MDAHGFPGAELGRCLLGLLSFQSVDEIHE
jgi:hypothetical protein